MKQALFVSIRRFTSTTLTSLLSFLIIVSPLFGKLSSRAHAEEGDATGDSFAFSDQSNSIAQAEATDAANNAVKGRSAPVSASGAFTHAVDIALPPGRNGFAPALSLTYDSEAFRTDSPVGTGWSFGVPSISRDTSNGFPKLVNTAAGPRYDNNGAFTGPAGPMVPYDENEGLDTQPDSIVYVPVREYEPVRFEYIPRQSRWIEHLPSGVKRFYGEVNARRARIVNELGAHTWLLLKERDTDGNTIEYDYFDLDDPEFGQDRVSLTHVQAAPVLRRVSWGGNERVFEERRGHIYHVLMDPEDYDTGPINMLAGHIQLRKTLERIVVAGPKVNGEPGNEAYWQYDLELTPSTDTERLLLRSVTFTAEGVDPIIHSFAYSENVISKPGIDPRAAPSCFASRRDSWGPPSYFTDASGQRIKGLYETGSARNLPAGATIWETDINRSLTPRHHAIGHKFTDLNADGLVDMLYHPIGGGAPNPQIVTNQSYIQTGNEWVPATSVMSSSGTELQGGMYNLPENMFVSALADIDGDVDPDAVSFATYMTPPTVVRDYGTVSHRSARPHHFANGIAWTPPAHIAERLAAEGLIDPDDLDVPGYWLEEYINEKAAGMVDRSAQIINAPPGCVPTFQPVRDFGNSWDEDQPGVGDGDGDLESARQLVGASSRALYYVDNGGPTMFSTLMDVVYPDGWVGTTWEDVPEWINQLLEDNRPPTAYVCLDIDNEAYSTAGTHTERIYIAKNSARLAPGEVAGPARAVGIEEWPDGVGKRLELRHESVPEYQQVPAIDGAGVPLWGLKGRTLYSVKKDFSAPMADINGDGKADLVLLKKIEPLKSPRRDGSHYNGVAFIPRAYLSNGETFVLDWESGELAAQDADVTNLVDSTWTIQAGAAAQLTDVVLPALKGLEAGTQTLPLSVSDVLRFDELDIAQTILASYQPGDHLDPALQREFARELVNAVESTFFSHTPRAEVSLRDIFLNYELSRQAMVDAGVPSDSIPSLTVDTDRVPDVGVDVSGILRSANGRVSVNLADAVALYQQQQAQPLIGDLQQPIFPSRPIPVDPDDYVNFQGGLSEEQRNAFEAIESGGALPPGFFVPDQQVVSVDVSELVQDTVKDDAADGIAPRTPVWETAPLVPGIPNDTFRDDVIALSAKGNFTSSAIDVLADVNTWDCDSEVKSNPTSGFARSTCYVQTTYPSRINYNSILLDLNGDGLSDLVVGRRPRYNKNPEDPITTCPAGHRVHLNRGYRWDLHEEQLAHSTAFEYWSSPTYEQYLGDADGVLADIDFPFEKLQNHHGRCAPRGGFDFQYVDFATFIETDTGQRLRHWASLPKDEQEELELNLSSLPSDALSSVRHDTLPMSAASFVDLNADGRLDLVFAVARSNGVSRATVPEQAVYLNTGRGFRKESGHGQPISDLPSGDFFGSPNYPGPEKSCLLPEDLFFVNWNMAKNETMAESDLSRLVDVDSDGLVDVVYRGTCKSSYGGLQVTCDEPAQWRRNLRKVPDLLTSVERSDGSWARIKYIAGTSHEARNGEATSVLPTKRTVVTDVGHLPTGQMVVQEVYRGAGRGDGAWAELGAGAAEAIELTYDNFVRQAGKSRAVGFETVRARHYNSTECNWTPGIVGTESCNWRPTVTSGTTYDLRPQVQGSPVAHPLRGQARTSYSSDLVSTTTVSTASEFVLSPLGDHAVRIRPRLDVNTTSVGSNSISSAVEYDAYDDFGYAQWVREGRWDGSSVTEGHRETTTFESTYHHVPGRWWLGREASSSLHGYSQTIDGSPVQDALLSSNSATYDTNDRLWTTSVLLDEGSDCTDGSEQWATTTFEYDAQGLVQSIDTNGREVQMRYEPRGLFVAQRWTTVPKSDFSPGATLREILRTDPRFGSVVYARDANGITQTATFDAQGRQRTARGPGGVLLSSRHYRDEAGKPSVVLTETYTEQDTAHVSYGIVDGAGNTLAAMSQDESGMVRTTHDRFDGFGRVWASYLPRKVVQYNDVALQPWELATVTTYDGFDRATQQVLPDGERTITHSYDIESWGDDWLHRVTTKDPRGNYALRYYDDHDQLSAVVRTAGGTNMWHMQAAFLYTRDGLGRIVEVFDSDSTVRNLAYNVGGGLAAVNLPYKGQAGGAHSYCYDDFGALSSATTMAGRTAKIHRDILGRTEQTVTTYKDDVAVTDFFYDCGADTRSLGRMCRMETDDIRTEYGYDDFGRNDTFTTTLDPEVAEDLSNEFSGLLEFGLAGQLKKATYTGLGNANDEHVIEMGHDRLARTTSIAVQTPSESRELVDNAVYDEMGRVKKVDLSNGVTIDREFDWATGFFTGAKFRRAWAQFAAIEYPLDGYDENGNPRQERRVGTNGQVLSAKTHTFDSLDRVMTSKLTMDGQVRASETYDYFSAGNIEVVGTLDGDQTYNYDEGTNYQAVTSMDLPTGGTRTLHYDPDGWLSSDITLTEDDDGQPFVEERTLEYDAAGCLREVSVTRGIEGSQGATHTTRNVCGLGSERLVRESTDPYGHTQRTYYLPGNVELRLGEGDDDSGLMMFRLPVSDVTVAQLAWNLRDGDILEEESGYVHTDLRGSVLARTSFDDNAYTDYVREAEYGAWGETHEYDDNEAPRYGFTGEEADPGTGYYYFGARVYDPSLRRWLSPDPLVTGVPAVDEDFGNELNLYAYSANNPVALTDPSGMLTDGGLKSDAQSLDAIASLKGTSRDVFMVAGAVAAFGGVAAVLEGSGAALVAPFALAIETGADVVSFGINLFNTLTASNPAEAIQSAAATGVAAVDAVSGPNPMGDVAAVQGANKALSKGSGGATPRKMGPAPKKVVKPRHKPADYSQVKDPKDTTKNTKPTPRQVREMKKANREQNGGVLRSDISGKKMVDSKKSQSGVTPPSNEAQVDHKKPRSKGGSRSNTNLQLATREENRDKSDK